MGPFWEIEHIPLLSHISSPCPYLKSQVLSLCALPS